MSPHQHSAILITIIVLVGSASFALGRLSMQQSSAPELSISTIDLDTMPAASYTALQANAPATDDTQASTVSNGGSVVGSKNGSKYHLPWCSGAKRIKDENLVVFESITKAQEAGYTPAANCPGLE